MTKEEVDEILKSYGLIREEQVNVQITDRTKTNVNNTLPSSYANKPISNSSTPTILPKSLMVANEGTILTNGVSKIDFVGTGVNATNSGTNVTVTITQPSNNSYFPSGW